MNPEQAKFLCRFLIETIKMEHEATKKVIRAVPDDKKAYKPETKSMTAYELAWHIASTEIWFMEGMVKGKFEMTGETPAAPPTIGAILEVYESGHREMLKKVQDLSADKLAAVVEFFGMQLPNVVYLNFMNLHSSHHRGQLSTYLRPMGSKVPSIYGGSADEPFQPEAAKAQ